MQVKKYRARTIKEATEKVKRVLGSEAMIISTSKVEAPGKNNIFEITAALAEPNRSDENINRSKDVRSQLMRIKEMIVLLNHSNGVLEKLIASPDILNLYGKMIRCGVNDQNARILFGRTGLFNGNANDSPKTTREKAIKEIMKVIEVKDPFENCDGRPVIAAFIGTTGVGKTTTIAKLAAQQMLKAKKKVGLISIDSYRIGAMEQLKTYAKILGIPCFQAFERKDLLFALRRLEGSDIILIDTAGQSQYDDARIEDLKRMTAGEIPIGCHLLLSVATTDAEMGRTAIKFSPLHFKSYIFTKMDEAECCGSILNQIMKLPLPVSYITTGQNVPEDIERAEKRSLLKLLFNKN
jgi:flagellar biosynthesis protein FlhF